MTYHAPYSTNLFGYQRFFEAHDMISRKVTGMTLTTIAVVSGWAVLSFRERSGGILDPSRKAKVLRGDLVRSVVAAGKIEPVKNASIKSKASGIVIKILKDTNDQVKEGDVLIELDKEEILASVHQSEAALAAAEAALIGTKAEQKRAESDAQSPELPILKRAYERARSLATERLISSAALEDAQKVYELAEGKRDAAVAGLALARANVLQKEAQIRQAKASFEQYQEQFRYATIRAPIDGIVLSRNVEIGDAVSSILVNGSTATEVGTIGDMRQVFVRGRVQESEIGKVYLGQAAIITVESFRDRSFTGKVNRILPLGVEKDNVTTFEVRVSIDNSRGELKSGMTANAEIVLEQRKGVLTVPEAALIYDSARTSVWVEIVDPTQKNGKRKVQVTPGISNGARTELLSELAEGVEVVLQQ